MNKLDLDYQELVRDILENGTKKSDRTGTGTLSVFSREIRHKMSTGFPLLTTKKMYLKGAIIELLWFLKGETNIKWLLENDCNIWNGDSYKNYKKVSEENNITPLDEKAFIESIKKNMGWDLGPIYGAQWRGWDKLEIMAQSDECQSQEYGKAVYVKRTKIDQIANLINDLNNNPDSRRLMVNAWNVGELDKMVLPPCHYGFQVYTRELSYGERCEIVGAVPQIKYPALAEPQIRKMDEMDIPKRAISLKFTMRSADVPLGLPFNLASYGLLLEIIAKKVNMIPDELIASLGDTHIYLNQIEGIKEQLIREPFKLPKIKIFDRHINDISEYSSEDFEIIDYKSHPSIKIPLSN